jgi:hypothetical protein
MAASPACSDAGAGCHEGRPTHTRWRSRESDDIRPVKPAEEVVDRLKDFHSKLAERLHSGKDVFNLIPEQRISRWIRVR